MAKWVGTLLHGYPMSDWIEAMVNQGHGLEVVIIAYSLHMSILPYQEKGKNRTRTSGWALVQGEERRDRRQIHKIESVQPSTSLTSALGLLLESGASSLPVTDEVLP